MAQRGHTDVCLAVGLFSPQFLEADADHQSSSGLTAFFDADLLGFDALYLTACSEALIAKHAQGFDFRALAGLFAVFQYLDITWARHAILVNRLFAFRHGAPKD